MKINHAMLNPIPKDWTLSLYQRIPASELLPITKTFTLANIFNKQKDVSFVRKRRKWKSHKIITKPQFPWATETQEHSKYFGKKENNTHQKVEETTGSKCQGNRNQREERRWTWFEDMVGRENSPANRTLHFALLLPCWSSWFFVSFFFGFCWFSHCNK